MSDLRVSLLIHLECTVFSILVPGNYYANYSRQEVERTRTSEMFMIFHVVVNNSLQTSNLRQGNIELLVASWAPLRYYLVAQLKFQSPWASGRPLISVPDVTLQCIVVSALKKTSKVNTILKVVIFKHSVNLFRCSMIW